MYGSGSGTAGKSVYYPVYHNIILCILFCILQCMMSYFLQGYKQRNAYIATQGPLQNTVNDVWRMLYEFKSRTLVMLCNMNENHGEAAHPYFPGREEEAIKYGRMLVTLQSKASYNDFIVRKFTIQEDRVRRPNVGMYMHVHVYRRVCVYLCMGKGRE